MKHVFKTVVKLVKSIASKGYANAMAEADEASRRDLKLHGIYNNQTGSGRRSFFRMKIGLPRLWFGSGDQYLRPEYRERARRAIFPSPAIHDGCAITYPGEGAAVKYQFQIDGRGAGPKRDRWIDAAEDAVRQGYATWIGLDEIALDDGQGAEIVRTAE